MSKGIYNVLVVNASPLIVLSKSNLLETIAPVACSWIIPAQVFSEITVKSDIDKKRSYLCHTLSYPMSCWRNQFWNGIWVMGNVPYCHMPLNTGPRLFALTTGQQEIDFAAPVAYPGTCRGDSPAPAP
jgi:hypothetical protein